MAGYIKIHTNGELDNDNYELKFNACGHEVCRSDKMEETEPRPYYSLHYVTRGSGYIHVGDEKISLKKSNIFLVYADMEHRYYPNRNDPWDYIWVNFTGENIEKLFSFCGITVEMPYVKDLKEEEVDRLSNLFLQLIDSHIASPASMIESASYLVRIISSLVSRLRQAGARQLSEGRALRDALIFMNCNYRIDINVRDIARNANISESYLYSLFSDEYGISPKHYLTLFRIASACELIKKKNKRLSEVALETGFNDPHYFSRCFSEIKGLSPREYAKACDDDNPWAFLQELDIKDYR